MSIDNVFSIYLVHYACRWLNVLLVKISTTLVRDVFTWHNIDVSQLGINITVPALTPSKSSSQYWNFTTDTGKSSSQYWKTTDTVKRHQYSAFGITVTVTSLSSIRRRVLGVINYGPVYLGGGGRGFAVYRPSMRPEGEGSELQAVAQQNASLTFGPPLDTYL